MDALPLFNSTELFGGTCDIEGSISRDSKSKGDGSDDGQGVDTGKINLADDGSMGAKHTVPPPVVKSSGFPLPYNTTDTTDAPDPSASGFARKTTSAQPSATGVAQGAAGGPKNNAGFSASPSVALIVLGMVFGVWVV